MANRWGNSGNSERLYLKGGSKITADGDSSHEIKDATAWKESYDQLSILKSTDITLLTKVRLVRAMVFPVVTYGECRRTDAFELWCWRRLLRVP